jgi:hypothetical protein
MDRRFESGERYRLSHTNQTYDISSTRAAASSALTLQKTNVISDESSQIRGKFEKGRMFGIIIIRPPPNEGASHRLNLAVFSCFS